MISAPQSSRSWRRSGETLVGSTTFRWYPLTRHTSASPMPVLPDVGSSRVAPGVEPAVLLRLLDHRQGDAVLHRATGVLALELDQDAHVGVGAERGDLDERRVADQVEDAGDVAHGGAPLPAG